MTYKIVAELSENQILELIELYKNEFWSSDRQPQDVVQMLAASNLIIGIVDDCDRLVAFARVLTDFMYRAVVFDVIVKPTHRGQGLGVQLMDAVTNHPKLCLVEQIALYCLPEMIPFYERWGFTADTGGILLMYRTKHVGGNIEMTLELS